MNITSRYRRQWISGLMLGFLLMIALACEQENYSEGNVSPDVDSLVNVFKMEALKRGVTVNTSNEELVIRFGDLGSRSGSCKPNTRPKIVTLDSLLWKHAPIGVKEMLLAHELGHCLLGLEHDNATLATGECKSWMRENGEVCKINFVNKVWRDYYLNALFSGGKTSAPLWCDPSRLPAESTELIATNSLNKHGGEVLDTAMLRRLGNWKVVLEIPEVNEMGVISFGINEYLCAFSFTDYEVPTDSMFQTIMLYQYRTPEHNILSSSIIPKRDACQRLIVERNGRTVFVFFDNRLKLCIPLDNDTVKLTWYSTFEREQNKMEVFKVVTR